MTVERVEEVMGQSHDEGSSLKLVLQLKVIYETVQDWFFEAIAVNHRKSKRGKCK